MNDDGVLSGVHLPLERAADELIFESLRGVTSQREKSDILTPWKMQDLLGKEIYSRTGTVDPQIRRGMFHRVANRARPHLNSREGVAPPVRDGNSSMRYPSQFDRSSDGNETEWT